MDRWQNKVAVVTGASAGIGAYTCKALVEQGMIVVGLARRLVKMKKQVLPTIAEDKQHNFHCFKCDVGDEESVKDAFEWVESKFGGVDVLINNAGVVRNTTMLDENNSQDLKDTINTNVMGVAWCVREAFRSMKRRQVNGHVIIINSIAGHKVPFFPGMSLNIYPPSKHAVTAMTEIFRQEFLTQQTKIKVTFSLVLAGNELWPMERPDGMPNIVSLEVMCGKDHMDVHLTFSHPFEGIVSSKGQHSDPRCVYVPPSTGKTFFSFRISYSRCGTKPDLNGQFYENTVVVQYDKDLLEVWDEAKRLRCEWFNDYEKTASKPPMVIADLDVIQLDFRGDNVDCWMEIQHGKGPWAPPVSGIVPLGSTLTLVVAINDYRGEFDMRVKSCVASDGSGHIINLSDEFGCVLRPKMISRFLKARAPDERATVITYAFFHAFKFPDALSVHIKCKVEICRHGCLDHCQLNENANERKDVLMNDNMVSQNDLLSEMGGGAGPNRQQQQQQQHQQQQQQQQHQQQQHNNMGMQHNINNMGGAGQHNSMEGQTNDMGMGVGLGSVSGGSDHDVFYDDIIHNRKQLSQINSGIANILDQFNNVHEKHANLPPRPVHEDQEEADLEDIFGEEELADLDEAQYMELRKSGKFPHGPRQLAQKRMGVPMAGPRSLEPKDKEEAPRPVYRPQAEALKQTREDHIDLDKSQEDDDEDQSKNAGNKTNDGSPRRRRRSIVISDRKVRSADVGVSGLYDVISEADLAFSPDSKQEAVTVFQGKISEEVVYGICMPVPGFSILFIVVISATIVSALIAGSLLYRYQLQKEALEKQTPMPLQGTLASWMTLRLFRMRQQQQQHQQSAQNIAAVAAVQNSLAAAAAAATLTHESVQ